MSHEEMSFCELKNKEIVNEIDGRRLGKTCDLIFSPHDGVVLGIVAPFSKRGLFFKGQEVFIPFKHISKIGPDVILVRLTSELSQPDNCVNMDKNERPGRFDSRKAAARNGREPGEDRYGRESGEDKYGRDSRGGRYERETKGDRYARGDGRDYYDEDDGGRAAAHADSPDMGGTQGFEAGGTAHDCDFRCEKCMLFDCNKRWKGAPRQKKRPPRAFNGEGDGSAYVDGKLYEANER